jgi:hypothetical protein
VTYPDDAVVFEVISAPEGKGRGLRIAAFVLAVPEQGEWNAQSPSRSNERKTAEIDTDHYMHFISTFRRMARNLR